MPQVKINGREYDVPEAVVDVLQSQNDYIGFILDKIRTVRLKKQTALRKPTKLLRLEAYRAEQELYNLLPDEVKQKELFR